jgi:hypothetical protein
MVRWLGSANQCPPGSGCCSPCACCCARCCRAPGPTVPEVPPLAARVTDLAQAPRCRRGAGSRSAPRGHRARTRRTAGDTAGRQHRIRSHRAVRIAGCRELAARAQGHRRRFAAAGGGRGSQRAHRSGLRAGRGRQRCPRQSHHPRADHPAVCRRRLLRRPVLRHRQPGTADQGRAVAAARERWLDHVDGGWSLVHADPVPDDIRHVCRCARLWGACGPD